MGILEEAVLTACADTLLENNKKLQEEISLLKKKNERLLKILEKEGIYIEREGKRPTIYKAPK